MVYTFKGKIKEFNPIRLRGITRKPLNRPSLFARSQKSNNTKLDPQLEKWFAESWRDNKDLYMALTDR